MSKILVDYLKKCDDAYYNSSNPLVPDSTYDALVETLRRLDPTNPYLSKVGAKVKSDKVGRIIPMGTLTKYHKDEEIMKWLATEGGGILLAPKYDGFAVELIYHNGKLISASTRGDGNVGEDVLAAMKQVHGLPLALTEHRAEYTHVRGEAIIPVKHREVVKQLGYSAMRNAVPGIVRSNRTDALAYVDFVAYEFIDGTDDRVEQRKFYGNDFYTEDYRYYESDDIESMKSHRESLRELEYLYELDGVVLKTRFIKEDDLLNPTHMIAWKYKSNREATTLRAIEYQLGVTGYFTPIGIFDEVEFQGAKLTRASLGNITRLKKEFEGMTIGSIVEVSRRGDIIPYIEGLALIQDGELVEVPKVCPHCGEPLQIDEEYSEDNKLQKYEPHCVNKSCPEKLRLQISQYVKTVGIKGIGDALVRGLIDAGHIKSLVDIYTIDPAIILTIPRQGQSAVDKWKLLQDKKLSPIEFLTAYPFIDLGKRLWETVMNKFTVSEILNITVEELVSAKLKGIGESKIASIVSQVSENKEELEAISSIHGVL